MRVADLIGADDALVGCRRLGGGRRPPAAARRRSASSSAAGASAGGAGVSRSAAVSASGRSGSSAGDSGSPSMAEASRLCGGQRGTSPSGARLVRLRGGRRFEPWLPAPRGRVHPCFGASGALAVGFGDSIERRFDAGVGQVELAQPARQAFAQEAELVGAASALRLRLRIRVRLRFGLGLGLRLAGSRSVRHRLRMLPRRHGSVSRSASLGSANPPADAASPDCVRPRHRRQPLPSAARQQPARRIEAARRLGEDGQGSAPAILRQRLVRNGSTAATGRRDIDGRRIGAACRDRLARRSCRRARPALCRRGSAASCGTASCRAVASMAPVAPMTAPRSDCGCRCARAALPA